MRFATPLVPATLIRRYKRFLSDIRLEDGTEAVAHCPNPGAMTGLAEPGARIWVEPNDDPKKKLKFGWRMTELPGGALVVIDTGLPNRVVGEALRDGRVPGLTGEVRAEVKYGEGSRVDFLLSGPPSTYVEVKAVSLRRQGTLAEFPDCVTARGARHMDDLAQVVRAGHRAVLIFALQRNDCDRVAVAADIDPAYARAFDAARAAGVEVLALAADITTGAITLGGAVPLDGG